MIHLKGIPGANNSVANNRSIVSVLYNAISAYMHAHGHVHTTTNAKVGESPRARSLQV